MRLFIGIDCDTQKEYFLDIQRRIKNPDNKMSYPSTFHITLKFLGEVEEDFIDEIDFRLKQIIHQHFNFYTDGIGFFPSRNYINVVWVGVEPKSSSDEIFNLKNKIEKSLFGMFKKEDNFYPHITIARAKSIKDKRALLDCIDKLKLEKKEIVVNRFVLYKSTLTPNGPIYEELKEYKLF